jgi:hypothetical protein
MESIVITFSAHSWNALEQLLSSEELSHLEAYFTQLLEKDLFERRCRRLQEQVRKELVRGGAARVFDIDLEEFARDPRGIVNFVTRTGEPIVILVDGKPKLIVQDVRNVARSPWEVFGKDRG